ncbi:MAG: hypothetical protein KH366_16365 [Clostridiaceae bacterium]|nr:hypothetical protein [Clostridiaceae bacterium]
MKKIIKSISIIAVISALLTLISCSSAPGKPALYIEKAVLSQQEEKIVQLLGADSGACIYDFVLDDKVKSIQINTYQLKDGKWELISGGGGQQFSDTKGRLALSFENISEGLRIAVQSENESGSTEYSTDPLEQNSGMGRATSMLNDLKEINYDQEIPLVIQIMTSKSSIYSLDVDYFFEPGQYEEYGYESVYAVTIRFSQKTVSELDRTA